MTDSNPVSTPPSLVDRAKAIIMKPKEEWPRIDTEPATIPGILTGYAMILAAIPPLCGLIGGQIFGHGALGITWRPSLMTGIGMAITQYVLSLAGLFVLSLVIDFLAPKFGGVSSKVQAFKVAAYAATAGWLAGVFSLVPALSVLGILGLYSLYLLYLGLPVLMKAPQDKALTYTIVTVIAAAVLFLIIGAITAPINRAFGGYGAYDNSPDTISGEVTVPGMGKVDLGKLNDATKQMEAAAGKMEEAAKSGTSAALAPATLQAMLPEKIGRFTRTEVESNGMSAGASARARYEAGDQDFRLEVTDMAAAGAFAGLGAAMNAQSNKETATGYERTSTVDGRIVTEEWDKEDKHGKFGTTIANRFMVEASGTVDSIDDLKGAVASVGLNKLEALAK